MHVARPVLTRPVLIRAAFYSRTKTMASIVRAPYPVVAPHTETRIFTSTGAAGPMSQDPKYPGTATERMEAARAAARALPKSILNGDWKQEARLAILGACEWTTTRPAQYAT
jgi:hypothetical protein